MKTFIILPGWTRSEKSYQELVKSAPKDCQVIITNHADIIPTGKVDDFINKFTDFLKKRNLSKVSLVGHSLGGALALEFIMYHPELIDKLYLVDSAGVYGEETIFQIYRNVIRNLFSRSPTTKLVRFFNNSKHLIRGLPMHVQLGHYAFKVDLRKHGSKIQKPTTILWGEQDVLTPLWQGRELQKAIPRSKLVVLKGQGHDWIVHSPELFWKNLE